MKEFFELAFEYILKFEGGISNNKNDPGKLTKFGISQKSYPDLNINNLTLENAREIYYQDFWLKNKCNAIKHKKIAIKLFDTSVNVGISQAVKILQRAIVASEVDINQDGFIGAKTIECVNSLNEEILLAAFKSELAGFYRCLIAKNSNLKIFKNGWLKRAYYKF